MTEQDRRLTRHLAVAVLLKLVALVVLWQFFVRDQRIAVDPLRAAENMAPAATASLPRLKRPPMISEQLVDLSRLQFAATAMYHFLFVPLTLGMVWLLVIMECVYVMTGKEVYHDMTRFWGKLFGINFALGVTTGLTMEFQFGTNWAYYSHYVGDIFGAPLAIEGLMAFFLESTMIGLFFFGWDRLTAKHLLVTLLMAIGTNLSALWILIANGWMQNPVGAEFNYDTMRMELVDFWAVLFNPTRRPSSCTRCRRAMSPAPCSCSRSRPGTCCRAHVEFAAQFSHRRRLRPGLGAA